MLAAIVACLAISGLMRTTGSRWPRRNHRPPNGRRPWATAARCTPADAPVRPTPTSSPAPPGTIALLEQRGERMMVLSGEIDASTVRAFDARASCSVPPNPATTVTVVDVAAVTFMNSYGLLLVLRCTQATRASGHRPTLLGPTPPVQRVLRLSGLAELFDTQPTPELGLHVPLPRPGLD